MLNKLLFLIAKVFLRGKWGEASKVSDWADLFNIWLELAHIWIPVLDMETDIARPKDLHFILSESLVNFVLEELTLVGNFKCVNFNYKIYITLLISCLWSCSFSIFLLKETLWYFLKLLFSFHLLFFFLYLKFFPNLINIFWFLFFHFFLNFLYFSLPILFLLLNLLWILIFSVL